MESIKQWFQDWSDACEYTNECIPDVSFLVPPEPFSALGSIGAACFIAWGWNESKVIRSHPRAGVMKGTIQAIRRGGLKAQGGSESSQNIGV
jgi:hypothetical protein